MAVASRVEMLPVAPHPAHLRPPTTPLHPLDTSFPSGPSSTSLPASPSARTPLSLDGQRAHLHTFSPPPSPSSLDKTNRKRNFFRIRRPSSSSAAIQPSYISDLRPLHEDGEPSRTSPLAPPRRAVRRSSRPSTSSGVVETRETAARQRGRSASSPSQSPLRGFGPIFNAGSDFVLQRKKSRGSKVRRRTEPDPDLSTVHDEPEDLQFSTTDRRILEELKHKMQAREAQFRIVNGKKHHPYHADVVPYPCSYERRVVDNDIWECKWTQQTCDDISFHVFQERPQKVLDIGCGTGSWILDCAMKWKETHFVGLDIVPLHADLQEVGSSSLASRITWVQANFLEGLPFPNEEFDFVHVKRIARGVPEDKWDALFEEIVRVMKPGGAVEMLEEELAFPGKPANPDVPEPADLPTTSSSPWSSTSVFELQTQPSHSSSNASLSSSTRLPKAERSRGHTLVSPTIPMGIGLAVPPAVLPAQPKPQPQPNAQPHVYPPQPHTYQVTKPPDLDAGHAADDAHEDFTPEAPCNPRDHSLLEYIYNEMHAARFVNLEPLALLANSLSLYFTDVRTHPPLILTFPPPPTRGAAQAAPDPARSHARASPPPPRSPVADSSRAHDARAPCGCAPAGKDAGERQGQGRTEEEHGAADAVSVSLAQLLHGAHRYVKLDDRRMSAFSPSSRASFPAPAVVSRQRSSSFSDAHARGLSRRTSAASSLTLAESDGDGATVVHGHGHRAHDRLKPSRLPNAHMTFDVRTLNMHLALRTQEIVACAENMWDFVLDRRAALQQEQRQRQQQQSPPPLPSPQQHGQVQRPRTNSKTTAMETRFENELMTMSRRDFDRLLSYFELDMQDSIGLGDAVRDRLGWGPPAVPPNERRKDFAKACKQWEVLQKSRPPRIHAHTQPEQPPRLPAGSRGSIERPKPSLEARREVAPEETSEMRSADGAACPGESAVQPGPQPPQSQSQSQLQEKPKPAVVPTRPPPAERVSRIMRVFVAWKS